MSEKERSFRDRPINIDEQGHRKWVYAKKPSGKWYRYRTLVSWILLAFFLFAPFIRVGGYPLIMLDIPDRKFIIFGAIFWAQDTFILALLMLSFVLFIILFTVTFGRIWCGWLCPQTIFLEMVFRKIEFLIEGDVAERRKLDNSPWSTLKVAKKSVKHGLFFLISVLMTNVFLMWFIGNEKLFALIREPISEHLSGFLIMLVISLVFYWLFQRTDLYNGLPLRANAGCTARWKIDCRFVRLQTGRTTWCKSQWRLYRLSSLHCRLSYCN
jgi:polyferredoxin